MPRGIYPRHGIAAVEPPEPSVEMAEVFERPEDRHRRLWAEAGADFAYFVVRFLQGRRRAEITPEEIKKTKLYARSDYLERRALEMVCADPNPLVKITPEDERQLRERDAWLENYIEGKNLGHADLVQQVMSIPVHVAERQRFDKLYFKTVYSSPELFRSVWGERG